MLESFSISNFVNDFSCNCRKVQKKIFKKNTIITTYMQNRSQFCILVNGSADLIRYNLNGIKTIVEHFVTNDLFGEIFYTINLNNELFVLAKEDCTVLFFDYSDVHTKCKKDCKFHATLSSYLPELILNKVIDLNLRIEVLTKRTIREKILFYFDSLSTRTLSKSFILPFSLTDLADYLSIDRSAMMREMKVLKEDGFIKKNKNKITLLY